MKRVINFFAYVAIIFVAIAITLGTIWKDIAVLRSIGEVMAYIITGIFAFYFARSKQHPAYMICFVVASSLIVLMLILGVTVF